jgi:hypothetical protein
MLLSPLLRFLPFYLFFKIHPRLEAYQNPQITQEQVRKYLLSQSAGTAYGKYWKLNGNESYEHWKQKLPLVSYEDLEPWIQQQKKDQQPWITPGKVYCYEKTSGSSGQAKSIPYNLDLLNSFRFLFELWVWNLLSSGPRFQSAKLFFSLSWRFEDPSSTPSPSDSFSGFEDDADYLSSGMQILFRHFCCVSPLLKKIRDPFHYKRILATSLLATASLEILSLWHPSYFLVLLEFIQNHKSLLLDDLHKQEIRRESFVFRFPPLSQERFALLQADPPLWSALWANLKLISCWTHSNAFLPSQRLRKLFPHTYIQGKGLLATEAPLTVPLLHKGSLLYLPLIHEVYFEFLDEKQEICRLEDVQDQQTYSLILSQKGGLLRYRLGDQVRIHQRYRNTPCFEFLGRDHALSDLVGEKLHEVFVQNCWRKATQAFAELQETPALLLPLPEHTPFYLLLLEGTQIPPSLLSSLENELQQGFHYRNARQFGQLGELRASAFPQLTRSYFDFYQSRGLKWGDLKIPLLWWKNDALAFYQFLLKDSKR